MFSFTVKAGDGRDLALQHRVTGVAERHGGSATWRRSARTGRAYALVTAPDDGAAAALRSLAASSGPDMTLYDPEIIALALFPSTPQALPAIAAALGGPGGPAGVLGCDPCDGGTVVEWNPLRTAPLLLRATVEVELRRWNAGLETELLAPLSERWMTAIAAEGLQCPQIAPDRVLEALLDRNGLTGADA